MKTVNKTLLERLSSEIDRLEGIEDAALDLLEVLDWHDVFRNGMEGLSPEDCEKVRLARLKLSKILHREE